MGKSLPTVWVGHKLGGMEPQGISRVGQIVLAGLMEFQIWHQTASSVWVVGGRAQKRDNSLCVGPAHSASLLCLPVWMGVIFLNSLVIRLPFNSISDSSE